MITFGWMILSMTTIYCATYAYCMSTRAHPAAARVGPAFPTALLGAPGLLRALHPLVESLVRRWHHTWINGVARILQWNIRWLPRSAEDLARLLAFTALCSGAAVLIAALFLSLHAPLSAGAVLLVGVGYIPARYLHTQRAYNARFIADIPLWIHMLMLASTAGVELGGALRESARLLADRPLGTRVLAELRSTAQGELLTGTLERLRTQHTHPLWHALMQLLIHALHTGAPALTVLQSLAEQSHAETVMRCEERGARLSHAILLPTVLCFLPAFFVVLAAALYLYLTQNPEWSQAWQMLAG